MNRLLNVKVDKALLAEGNESHAFIGTKSFKDLLLKLPIKAYNAFFTPMGRKSLYYFLKRCQAGLNPDYRRDGKLVYQLDNGSGFVLHRGNHLSELVFFEGAYEPLETLIVSKAVRQNDIVLDLGANVGYYTALLDRLVKPAGQVHSFEPGEGTFAKLEDTKNLLNLNQTVLHPKAVGDALGYIDFWSSTSGSDAQQNTVKNLSLGRYLRHDKVQSTTLDAFMAESQTTGKQNIAFIKCDIEGAEPAMLKGAQNLLNSQNPPIWLMEHNRPALVEHGASSLDLLAPFKDYDVYFVQLCWPPSIMASAQACKWNGIADELPDECNLVIIPKHGVYAKRAESLRQAKLIP
jgi:FkbM family methyltransferase